MFFIDVWSVGLDEIPRKEITVERILTILHREGRFSSFEASANPAIAKAMTAILKSPLIEIYLPDRFKGKWEIDSMTPDKNTYPWTYVRLTQEGLKAIGAVGGEDAA